MSSPPALVVVDGRDTGDIEFYAYGEGKATAMRELARQRGYDLDRCWPYSESCDSCTDRPMLELVGNPVAANPASSCSGTPPSTGTGGADRIERLLKM